MTWGNGLTPVTEPHARSPQGSLGEGQISLSFIQQHTVSGHLLIYGPELGKRDDVPGPKADWGHGPGEPPGNVDG